jgi:hypothetical protein
LRSFPHCGRSSANQKGRSDHPTPGPRVRSAAVAAAIRPRAGPHRRYRRPGRTPSRAAAHRRPSGPRRPAARAGSEHRAADLRRFAADGDGPYVGWEQRQCHGRQRRDSQAGGEQPELGPPVAHDVVDVGSTGQARPHSRQHLAGVRPAGHKDLAGAAQTLVGPGPRQSRYLMPRRASVRLLSRAWCRLAAAMLVMPAVRRAPMAALRRAAMTCGPVPGRIWLRSSS